MSSNKYTLDRYEGDYGIFLLAANETVQKIIHRSEMTETIAEGEVVLIEDSPRIKIIRLQNETANQRARVNRLLERLKQKNK